MTKQLQQRIDDENAIWVFFMFWVCFIFFALIIGIKIGADDEKSRCTPIQFPRYFSHSFRIPEDIKPGTYHVELEISK